jgi:hypothetical protein
MGGTSENGEFKNEKKLINQTLHDPVQNVTQGYAAPGSLFWKSNQAFRDAWRNHVQYLRKNGRPYEERLDDMIRQGFSLKRGFNADLESALYHKDCDDVLAALFRGFSPEAIQLLKIWRLNYLRSRQAYHMKVSYEKYIPHVTLDDPAVFELPTFSRLQELAGTKNTTHKTKSTMGGTSENGESKNEIV